jgi:hypothetical protein
LLSGAPRSSAQRERLDRLVAAMNAYYSKVTVCEANASQKKVVSNKQHCLRYTPEIEALFNNISTDAARLKSIWVGWHNAMDGNRSHSYVSLNYYISLLLCPLW